MEQNTDLLLRPIRTKTSVPLKQQQRENKTKLLKIRTEQNKKNTTKNRVSMFARKPEKPNKSLGLEMRKE